MAKSPFEPCSGARNESPRRPDGFTRSSTTVSPDHPARGQARAACTRNGHDWCDRFPLISEAALRTGQLVRARWRGRAARRRRPFGFQRPALAQARRRGRSSTPSISWSATARTSADRRFSMRKTNLARLLAHRVDASSSPTSSRARSPGPVPPRLPDGAGGAGLEASREHISRWPVQSMDQGQEPETSGLQPRPGSVLGWRQGRCVD